MQSKFKFSLDGVDATARQFAEVRRQLVELSASVGKSVGRLGERVSGVERDFKSLVTEQGRVDADGNPTGVDYPRLSVAALRLAQQAMSEVDELRDEVARLSSVVGKMGVSTSE